MLSEYCPGPRRSRKNESGQGGEMRWVDLGQAWDRRAGQGQDRPGVRGGGLRRDTPRVEGGGAGLGCAWGPSETTGGFRRLCPHPLGTHGPQMPRLPSGFCLKPLSPDGGAGGGQEGSPSGGVPQPCRAGSALSLGGGRGSGDREASHLAGEPRAGFCC